MKCPQCNSENIQMQSQPGKSLPVVGFVLAFGGFGLMFLGILGAIIGAVLGAIIGSIVKACVSPKYETVAVCQSCGYTSSPADLQYAQSTIEPVTQNSAHSTLTVSRRSAATGSVINMLIQVDERPPFTLSNGAFRNIILEEGEHQIKYEQQNGLGKSNRQGVLSVCAAPGAHYSLVLMLTERGLDISKSW